MEKHIGCHAHRRYSIFVTVDEKGQVSKPTRSSTKQMRGEVRGEFCRLEWNLLWKRPAVGGLRGGSRRKASSGASIAARRMLGVGIKTDALMHVPWRCCCARHASRGLGPGRDCATCAGASVIICDRWLSMIGSGIRGG